MFYQDWKFWLFLVTIANTGLTFFALLITKLNDLKHIQKNLEKIIKKVDNLERRLSFVEGIISRHLKNE